MFEAIISLITSYDTVIIHRHKNPDGDALGSQTGLKFVLRENFPDKRILCVGDAAGRYSFMEGSEMDDVADSDYEGALALLLDTPSKALASDERYTLASASARLDHHIFCEKIANEEVIDTSYESCCGLVTEMVLEAGWTLSARAAKALYTGMITDSGRFRYDSTTAQTFRLASALMERKFSTADIYRSLYVEDYSFIKLRAEFVLKIRFTESRRVAYIYTTAEEAAGYDADIFTISRGMVNVMSEIRGVEAWVNFTESDDGVFAELRSRIIPVYPIAKKFGGGGHAKACGATLDDRDTAMQMLSEIEDLIATQS